MDSRLELLLDTIGIDNKDIFSNGRLVKIIGNHDRSKYIFVIELSASFD